MLITGLDGYGDEATKFTGTQINYYFVCKRKLWLFSHNLELETESDLVHLGRLLHEQGYKRKLKEVSVDRIKVDFLERKEARAASDTADEEGAPEVEIQKSTGAPSSIVIHEIKRSRSMHDAHVFQLLYYIYYLKMNYNANVSSGMLHYPLLKTNVPVDLTEQRVKQVEDVMTDIKRTISLPNPPAAVWIKPCKSCAYREMCWG